MKLALFMALFIGSIFLFVGVVKRKPLYIYAWVVIACMFIVYEIISHTVGMFKYFHEHMPDEACFLLFLMVFELCKLNVRGVIFFQLRSFVFTA